VRLLFCNYEYPPIGGGGGVVMAALARALARRHEVTVLTSRIGDLEPVSVENGVRVVRVQVFFRRQREIANLASMAAYLPAALRWGLRLSRDQRFDVINTHFAVPTGPLGDWLSRRMNVPNVLSVHGGDLFDPSKTTSPHRHAALRLAVSTILRRADTVVAQSRDTAARIRRFYGVERPVKLVPLGIERPPETLQAQRADFGLPANACVLVTVGRVIARKACVQLARMLALAHRADVYLLMVGAGPDLPCVRELAAELGVADRIRFLGHVTDAEKFRALSVADVFVSTSQHEGFGIMFLEAMALGLPIVCYDHGGQTDYLLTPDTGFVVPLNDIGAFTARVLELLASPEHRAAIARNNRLKVEQFLIERCAFEYEAIFEEVVHRREAAASLLQRPRSRRSETEEAG
jgi:glycosyltransferase involved in cell wall biosynthesis